MNFNYDPVMTNAKEVVLQTRVTAAQYKTIETAARDQGVSVAAFVRAAALHSATMPLVRAWVTPFGEPPATVLGHDRLPNYMLKRIASGMSEQTFAMFQLAEHGLAPVSRSSLIYEMEFLKQPVRYQVVLDGSQNAWLIVRSMFNSASGLAELVLRPDGTPADVIRRRIYEAKKAWLRLDLINGQQVRGRVDVTGVGIDSFELEIDGEPTRTVPYASVVGVSNA